MVEKELILREIIRIKDEVDRLRKLNSFVFPLYSDLHCRGIENEAAGLFVDCLGELCSEINPTAVINLGDNFAMLGREKRIETTVLAEKFNEEIIILIWAFSYIMIKTQDLYIIPF